MTETRTFTDQLFAVAAAVTTTFTLLVVSFAPPASSLTGVVA